MSAAPVLDQAVPDDGVAAFLAIRPRLFGVAYRMLGSAAEADDVVQEAWIRWQRADRSAVDNPAAFLTTTTTRLAINALTSARTRRETYPGPWFPEPVDTSADPTLGAERAEALDLAVLTLLEKMSPAERAAYVLREAFGYSHRQVADILETSEANARQLARRARLALASDRPAPAPAPERRRELVRAFLAAAQEGRMDDLERLLARDVVMRNDGGGRVHAARRPIVGLTAVMATLRHAFARWWPADAVHLAEAELNGAPTVLVTDHDGAVLGVLWFDGDGAIETMYTAVNPDKLGHLSR